MELKYNTDATVNAVVAGSNRTFMELKCNNDSERLEEAIGSNRTFMELKLMSIGAVAWKR